ncbi:MAG: TauD/TfdA family dioxygenase [Gammaproteobacteria bacterium]|nr:TauD/TfdA family dioxygenase [Gammaproteobacteria bacterium]
MKLVKNPYLVENEQDYQSWRQQKLADYPANVDALLVSLQGDSVSDAEVQKLHSILARTNMAIYRLPENEEVDKGFVRGLGQKLGLNRLDGNLCADDDSITSLQVVETGRHSGYIPYTSRRLSWHTDGYYNPLNEQIKAIVMHCVRPAASGGENLLLDHEIAYIQLRDENPHYINALMNPDAMLIPPNIENGEEIRAAQSGPVFSIDESTASLHMRYTARTRNIEWANNSVTREAVAFINECLTPDNPYVFTHRLNAGEGIICNNVLHNRTAFEDDTDHKRLLYRARYYDRVANT